jgi:hypothetical protein
MRQAQSGGIAGSLEESGLNVGNGSLGCRQVQFNSSMNSVGFGDRIRIRVTPVTEELGLSGRTGLVYGFTMPSLTGVQVVGDRSDCAVCIKIQGEEATRWIDPSLNEFIDHAPGMKIRVGTRSWIRGADGEWAEETPAKGIQPE